MPGVSVQVTRGYLRADSDYYVDIVVFKEPTSTRPELPTRPTPLRLP